MEQPKKQVRLNATRVLLECFVENEEIVVDLVTAARAAKTALEVLVVYIDVKGLNTSLVMHEGRLIPVMLLSDLIQHLDKIR